MPSRWVESKWDALLGASGDHGLVVDLLWDDVREWFQPDGSLLDAYVFDATVGDWQAFVDLVQSKGWWFAYSEDGRPRRLPACVEDVFAQRGEMVSLQQVRPSADAPGQRAFLYRWRRSRSTSRPRNSRARSGSICCAVSFGLWVGGWVSR